MQSFLAFVATLFLTVATQVAEAAPEAQAYGYPTYGSCPGRTRTLTIATTTTTALVSTYTTRISEPYSCYTQYIGTPTHTWGCPTFTCLPPPSCTKTTTSYQPCRDRCCPVTETVYTPSGCPTCRTGCATSTTYVPSTRGCNTRY